MTNNSSIQIRSLGIDNCPICGLEFNKYIEKQKTCGDRSCSVRYQHKKNADLGLCIYGDKNPIAKDRSDTRCSKCLDKGKKYDKNHRTHVNYKIKFCPVCHTIYKPKNRNNKTCGKNTCSSIFYQRTQVQAGICVRCKKPIAKNSKSRCSEHIKIARIEAQSRKLRNK